MSNNIYDPLGTEKVTVPVKRVGEHWEFFYGGDVPVKEGTLGVLTFSLERIADEKFRERVTTEKTFKVLDEGAALLVALSDRSKQGGQIGPWPKPYPLAVPPGTTRWETVVIGPPREKPAKRPEPGQQELLPERGGLWLKLKGLEKCELLTSTVLMPKGFQEPTAISLNHAFTLLSREYEKHRISNTGNVYTRVFYQDRDKCWYPLDDLRRGVQAKAERTLLNQIWADIEKTLGWRPVFPSGKGRGKQ